MDNEKTYTIEFDTNLDLDDLISDEEKYMAEDKKHGWDVSESEERINKLNEIKGWLADGVKIKTFEDYTTLLEKVSEYTDGDYQVWNDGMLVGLYY